MGNGQPIWFRGVVPMICDEIIVLLLGECSLPVSVMPATMFVGIAEFGTAPNSLAYAVCSDVMELLPCAGK